MQFQKPAMVQRQELKLSPQMIQSIQLLALPLQDLKQRIEDEIEANPALEIMQESASVSLEDAPPLKTSDTYEASDYTTNHETPDYEGYDDEAGDNKRRFMEQALSRPESLQEHLIWQLRLQPLPEDFFQIGELLIRNLDENGFHREDPTYLVSEDQYQALEQVKRIIQTFEPAGCCVQDYKESLRVQAAQFADCPPAIDRIIDEFLEALDKGRYKEIAKALGQEPEDIEDALHFLQQLTPFPGRRYSSDPPAYVIPDLQVTRRDGEFVIILNDEEIPVIGINPFFDELIHQKGKDSGDVKHYVQDKIKDARWFINSIRMRNETLTKVASAIVEFQREFFLRGPRSIVPLTLRDIAGEIGVHEATVSRLTNGKYVQTDWGIYELKYFFSNAIQGTDGQRFSKEGVKQRVKEILQEEGNAGLSDQKISELLEKRGVKIARRTVAKYRKELDIDSSYGR